MKIKSTSCYVLLLILFIIPFSKAQDDFPAWAKGIVWYQIFPERFADGDSSNEPSVDKIELETGRKINE